VSEDTLIVLIDFRVSIDGYLLSVGVNISEDSFSLIVSSATYSTLSSFIIFYILVQEIVFFYFFSEDSILLFFVSLEDLFISVTNLFT
jgi:hypothetical protein